MSEMSSFVDSCSADVCGTAKLIIVKSISAYCRLEGLPYHPVQECCPQWAPPPSRRAPSWQEEGPVSSHVESFTNNWELRGGGIPEFVKIDSLSILLDFTGQIAFLA
jgi:hypothetical protein